MKQAHIDKIPEYWLAMDTSTAAMSIAVFHRDKPVAESQSQSERNHSIRLIPAIQELLQSSGLTMKHIGGVCTGFGPGSYTGVRIGVTVAKTLAWALSLPLIGVSSLEALAYGSYTPQQTEGKVIAKQWIIPLMDARRGQAYTSLYGDEGAGWTTLIADEIDLFEAWLKRLQSVIGQEAGVIRFVGETTGFEALIEAGKKHFQAEIEVCETSLHADHIGRLALRKWERGETEDAHAFSPNYTQLAEAEKKLLAKQK